MPDVPVFPELGSYPNSTNMIFEQGKAMPAWDHGAMTNSADIAHYFIKDVIEAQNPDGNPRNYAFGNNFAFYEEDMIRTLDQTFTALNVVQGAVIVEGPPITAASGSIPAMGVKKLLVTFGASVAGLAETTRLRTLTTDTSPWTAAVPASTVTQATMFKVINVGPDLIAATGSGATTTNLGRTVLGEYRIAKCPAGSDPTLAASWVNIIPVGSPEWPINELAPLFDSFMVGKGDGPYFWNDRVKRMVPALSRLKYRPHALNCKGMTAGENCVWIPMADGRLFKFDGVTAKEETPTKGIVVPRDFYASRITAVVDDGDTVAVRTEPFYTSLVGPRASAALGLKVIIVKNSVATDITSSVVNGKINDGGVVGGLGAVASDKIYFGASAPFEAAILRVTRKPNAAATIFASPQYSDGAAGWPSLGTIRDGTILGPSTISLALTGYPPGASEAILSWTAANAYDLMKAESVAFGGSVGTIAGLYWARFSFNNTTGLTATTEIDEVDLVPSRGGLPNTGLISTSANNYSHRLNAGGIGLVYWGKNVGGRYQWQAPFAIDDGGGVWAMSRTVTRTGTMTNGGSPLVLWGRYQQTIIAIGTNNNPSQALYPKLVQGGSGKPFPKISVRKLQLGDPTKKSRLNRIVATGEFITQVDQLGLYAWWDNEDAAIELDTSYGAPWEFISAEAAPLGRELNFDLLFYDASQNDPTAPYISKIVVNYDDEDGPLTLDSNFAVPEKL